MFILGQLSSKSLSDIQMEILNKKLDIRLGFRGEVWPGNNNDQFRYGNQSLETRCDHIGRMQIEKSSKTYDLSYSNSRRSGR